MEHADSGSLLVRSLQRCISLCFCPNAYWPRPCL